jgi:glycosyltransferase involved in cell wall biosynthesis
VKLNKIAVTASPLFLHRYRFLYQVLRAHVDTLQLVACGDPSSFGTVNRLADLIHMVMSRVSRTNADRLFQYNAQLFVARSRNAQRKLRSIEELPDLVFHVFGMFGPFWDNDQLPYVMYLDYTMALAARSYPQWAPFANRGRLEEWLACERHTYSRARILFTMSELVKRSLVQDYDISGDRIHVVGASGMFLEPHHGHKTFGTRQILFNGTEFERKGGDLVIEAFRDVRCTWPDARLVILGKSRHPSVAGVQSTGYISSPEKLERVFLDSDVVVAPGYCDPFPSFLIEAMNYGVPCIVSPRDGMPEIVDHGRTGLVLPELNARVLAEGMKRLLSDPTALQAMSDAARERVRTRLNWSLIGGTIVRHLAQL